MNLDVAIFKWANSWAGISPFFDWAIIFRAEYLGWVVGILTLVFIFWPRDYSQVLKNIRIALEAVLAALVSRFAFTEIIRYFYSRPRPFEVLQNVHQLLSHEAGGSFPSGHAAFFFALATSVFFYRKIWGIIFFLAALSIGFGRVAAGLHWPSDIFGGAIVGVLTSLVINFLAKKLQRPESGI